MEKKKAYVAQVQSLFREHKKVMIVSADFVGSKQLADVRKALRGEAQILMGKNTLMKKGILSLNDEKLKAICPYIKKNVGLIFVSGSLQKVRDVLSEHKVAAPAKAGTFAPVDVVLPSQNTGMEPTKTSFFQALNIVTKITKGTVEIINDTPILQKGDKVGSSEAALLAMLGTLPFFYGLLVEKIYDNGAIYGEEVLNITDDVLAQRMSKAIANIASIGLETGIPSEASVPHSLANGFKNLLAVSVETGYSFKQAEAVLAFLKDPSKFVKVEEKKEDVKVAAKPKSESEEGDMGMGLFGGGGDDDEDDDDSD